VCKIQPSIHAAYQENKEAIQTSITAFYDKLSGIDTATSRGVLVTSLPDEALSIVCHYRDRADCENNFDEMVTTRAPRHRSDQ
jgi:hypothetical protein